MHNDREGSGEARELPALPDIAGLGAPAAAPAPAAIPAQTGTPSPADPPILPGRPQPDAGRPQPAAGGPHRDDGAEPPALRPPREDPTAHGAPPPPATGGGSLAHLSDMLEEEVDQLKGKIFGGYELLQKIGQGGMGVVYKACQVSLDRVVAIKILSKSLSDNQEFIKRFEREAKSIARITHPNIVAVYDFGRIDGLYFMVNEFVEGSNLARIINEKLVMQIDELLPTIVHCLAGIAHVGQGGIVHRDIKPDNILITKDGVAKIADFGLAKDVTNDTDLTAVGLAMGTPAYMSPEQCMGRKLDVRSDIYALGVTAYFALTGEKPFTGQSSFEIMTKQREYNPPPPSQLNPRLNKDVSALVMRMMAKNPRDRFVDATACREAWLEIGQKLGLLGAPSRSGEYHFTAAELAKLKGAAPAEAQPPSSVMAPLAPLPAPPQPMMLPPAPVPVPVSGPPEATPATEEPAAPARQSRVSTDRNDRRPTTERRAASPVRAATADAVTCPKCGMLNRAELKSCQRCASPLREETEVDAREQEAEAQRRLEAGDYKGAAELFARLADRTEDRRARSILRSREREARRLEQEHQVAEIEGRSRNAIERGDVRGGIDALERGLREVRAASTSAAEAEGRLQQQIDELRGRLRRRRRMLSVVLAVFVLGALAGGAWYAWRAGWIPGLPPATGVAP